MQLCYLRLVVRVQSFYHRHHCTNKPHRVIFHVYTLIPQTVAQTHPSPTLCTFHPPPRLTLPGCHNDWLSMLQPEGDDVIPSLSVCPSCSLTYCFSSVCLKPVSWHVFSISLLSCLSDWLRARLSVWMTSCSFASVKACLIYLQYFTNQHFPLERWVW